MQGGGALSELTDVWACGIIMLKLLLVIYDKKVPNINYADALKHVESMRDEILSDSLECYHLLKSMLSESADHRPLMRRVVRNKWFYA